MKEKRKKKQRSKRTRGTEAKLFCCAFKLGFLQLLCKSFFNFLVEFRVSFINYFKAKTII